MKINQLNLHLIKFFKFRMNIMVHINDWLTKLSIVVTITLIFNDFFEQYALQKN